MSNYPAQFEPKVWTDVKYQPIVVNRIQNWIKTGSWPNQIFVSGGSGVGKTSTFRLAIRAVHCLNRSGFEVDPCGKCGACLHDPIESEEIGNIIWVQAESTEGQTYQASIKEALNLIDRGPRGSDPDKDILFVVFNECHLIPNDLLQRALAKSDILNPKNGKVCMVFMSMSPDEIKPTARQALIDRGEHLIFNSPTEGQLQDYLLSKYDNLSIDAAKMIASCSGRSFRGALSQYKNCLGHHKYLTTRTVADSLRLLTNSSRYRLWQMLKYNSKPKDIRQYLDTLLEYCNPQALMTKLYEDLEDNAESLTTEQYLGLSQLFFEYFKNPIPFNVQYVLLNLRGLKIDIQIDLTDQDNLYEFFTGTTSRQSIFSEGYNSADTLAEHRVTLQTVV